MFIEITIKLSLFYINGILLTLVLMKKINYTIMFYYLWSYDIIIIIKQIFKIRISRKKFIIKNTMIYFSFFYNSHKRENLKRSILIISEILILISIKVILF